MGNVGGPRHFGAITPQQAPWTCPSCHTKQTSRFEDGCPSCGAGTPEMNAAAQQPVPISPVELTTLVLGGAAEGMREAVVEAFVELRAYTVEARTTIAHALAFAAENGMARDSETLPPKVMLAWARRLIEALEPKP